MQRTKRHRICESSKVGRKINRMIEAVSRFFDMCLLDSRLPWAKKTRIRSKIKCQRA